MKRLLPIKQFGITPPVDETPPTELHNATDLRLLELLHVMRMFESDDEGRARQEILCELEETLQQWVGDVSVRQGVPENTASALLCTFGSYRLGVHGSGADIDALCIGPAQVSRGIFFTELHALLLNHPAVTNFSAVPDAYVPVLKFRFSGIEFDLTYCQLASGGVSVSKSFNVFDDAQLRGMDEKSILSLNGTRVTDSILALVPHVDRFRVFLRCIKHWAKVRGIYSNKFGYPGGVAWAIMAARVCQLYPAALPCILLEKFFRVYDRWQWPKPVELVETIDLQLVPSPPVWTPYGPGNLMPVITPAYPAMNSTYNIGRSSMRILLAEFKRGLDITNKMNQTPSLWKSPESVWLELFQPSDFFLLYKDYLQVNIFALSEDLFNPWFGYVESQLRKLIEDTNPRRPGGLAFLAGVSAHAHPYSFDTSSSTRPFSRTFYIGLDFGAVGAVGAGNESLKKHDKLNIACAPANACGMVVAGTRATGASSKAVDVDITIPVLSFKESLCESFMKKTADMDIDIAPLKRSELPESVFPDARRPTRKKRSLAASASASYDTSCETSREPSPQVSREVSSVEAAEVSESYALMREASVRMAEVVEDDSFGKLEVGDSTDSSSENRHSVKSLESGSDGQHQSIEHQDSEGNDSERILDEEEWAAKRRKLLVAFPTIKAEEQTY